MSLIVIFSDAHGPSTPYISAAPQLDVNEGVDNSWCLIQIFVHQFGHMFSANDHRPAVTTGGRVLFLGAIDAGLSVCRSVHQNGQIYFKKRP